MQTLLGGCRPSQGHAVEHLLAGANDDTSLAVKLAELAADVRRRLGVADVGRLFPEHCECLAGARLTCQRGNETDHHSAANAGWILGA